MKLKVEYTYYVHGKKGAFNGSDVVTAPNNTPSDIIRVLRLLHPTWERFTVKSSTAAE